MFNAGLKDQARGHLVEPQLRLEARGGRKRYFPSSICSLCVGAITAQPNLAIYACGHSFHYLCCEER